MTRTGREVYKAANLKRRVRSYTEMVASDLSDVPHPPITGLWHRPLPGHMPSLPSAPEGDDDDTPSSPPKETDRAYFDAVDPATSQPAEEQGAILALDD